MMIRNAFAAIATTLAVTVVLAAPAAEAFPVLDAMPSCGVGQVLQAVPQLAPRYARYFDAGDWTISDANGNGLLCVAGLTDGAGNGPITFGDDASQ